MHAFSPKNPIFCTFLQGGGTTFWQAQNRGFGGSRGRASGPAQDLFFASEKLPTDAPARLNRKILFSVPENKKFIFIFLPVNKNFRQGTSSKAPVATKMEVWT
jgi:hypothetical protein